MCVGEEAREVDIVGLDPFDELGHVWGPCRVELRQPAGHLIGARVRGEEDVPLGVGRVAALDLRFTV